MIALNLRLVVSIAKLYSTRSNLDLLDLIQEGTFGLFKAVGQIRSPKRVQIIYYAYVVDTPKPLPGRSRTQGD